MDDILLPIIMAAVITLASIATAKILQGKLTAAATEERRAGLGHPPSPEAKRS